MSDRHNSYNTNHKTNRTSESPFNYEQGSLFGEGFELSRKVYDSGASYAMGSQSLLEWKRAIAKYQGSITKAIPVTQTTLFEIAPNHCDPHSINPFALSLHPAEFYRLPSPDSGDACIYFVIDLVSPDQLPVLLYIGETCRSSKRWKGVHDCKRYVSNYRDLHVTHNQLNQVVMSFWWDAPAAFRPRQQLEKSLIEKWRSPFNKENWSFWGTPFVN